MKWFKHTITVLFVAFLFAVLAFVGYYGLYQLTNKSNAEIGVALTQMAFEAKIDDRLTSLSSIVAESQAERERLDMVFVEKNGLDFITKIEEMATHAGVTLAKDLDTTALPPNYAEIAETLQANMEIKGPWNNVFYFVELVESMPYKIDIDSMAFIYERGNMWKANMRIRTLLLKK
ncbi:MAG TPA: hypothetical protein VI981_01035 [Candidatus Paceibacterota bacterium]